MDLIVAALTIGTVVGLARGGRLRHLSHLRFRWPLVGVVGVAGLALVRWGSIAAPEMLLATALLLCGVFVVANRNLGGLGVVGVGIALNLAPLLANGTVPVDPDALVHAGLVERADLARYDLEGGRRLVDERTVLADLGERIPVPELDTVLSFGDLVIVIGLGAAAGNAVRRRRPGGVSARDILDAEPDRIDLTDAASAGRRASRRQRPVEVSPGRPVAVPMGWAHDDDEPRPQVPRGPGAPAPVDSVSMTHVPWPWRRPPAPGPHHPTMRVGRS